LKSQIVISSWGGLRRTTPHAFTEQSYRINDTELLLSRRGVFNEPRNVAIYLMRRVRGDSLRQIGEQFQMTKYSSVSSVIERMKVFLTKDRKLRVRMKNFMP
jgi:chromosomal replication initiation ATPase DnaA